MIEKERSDGTTLLKKDNNKHHKTLGSYIYVYICMCVCVCVCVCIYIYIYISTVYKSRFFKLLKAFKED